MDSIRFENVSKSFGKTKIINNLNLSIEKGAPDPVRPVGLR